MNSNSTNKPNWVVIISALLITAGILASCFGSSGSSGGGSGRTATCKSCGRSFPAGDSGGNYMSIARTGMCKNCYNNYQWGKDAIGAEARPDVLGGNCDEAVHAFSVSAVWAECVWDHSLLCLMPSFADAA
ncbi:MAG: hypothetical protein IJ112_00820 [Oscillospiraceae bacterium]|nr:hypothetical protein [Oscillospiraceae bacterium]